MDDRAGGSNSLAVAAVASLAAAVLHAAAAGIHADTVGLSRIFVALAVAQGAVAVLAFVRPNRLAAALLVVVNAAALAGWIVTRVTGISWTSGLEVAERPQPADAIAATFAAVAVAAAAIALVEHLPSLPSRVVLNASIVAGVLVIPGLANATDHEHGELADGHDHVATEPAPQPAAQPAAQPAGDGAAAAAVPQTGPPDDGHDHPVTTDPPAASDGSVPAPAPAPDPPPTTHPHLTTTPYDPSLPIDLGGVEGVTPQQQAFAENLVAATVRDLPQWSDLAAVESAGFRSIGDGATGHEHYIQWDWIDDEVWLDPDHPESLVFEPQPDGSKQLVSAMFMLPGGYPLEDVPDWGGALMQWHVHGDLCFTDDPEAPQVAGLKPLGNSCTPPLVDFPLSPMIHVWITPTPCGPFAALEGIAGGQVPTGENVLCDHAHGSA